MHFYATKTVCSKTANLTYSDLDDCLINSKALKRRQLPFCACGSIAVFTIILFRLISSTYESRCNRGSLGVNLSIFEFLQLYFLNDDIFERFISVARSSKKKKKKTRTHLFFVLLIFQRWWVTKMVAFRFLSGGLLQK